MNTKDNYSTLGKVLFTKDHIAKRVVELGTHITKDYTSLCNDTNPLIVISILKGSVIFFADLIREIQIPSNIDFLSVSSYVNTQSKGHITLNYDISLDISNRNVLIVEDIIDSGLSIKYIRDLLQNKNPTSIKTCTLLYKEGSNKSGIIPDYYAFNIGNDFVVGYGLDYDQQYRNLPYITTLALKG